MPLWRRVGCTDLPPGTLRRFCHCRMSVRRAGWCVMQVRPATLLRRPLPHPHLTCSVVSLPGCFSSSILGSLYTFLRLLLPFLLSGSWFVAYSLHFYLCSCFQLFPLTRHTLVFHFYFLLPILVFRLSFASLSVTCVQAGKLVPLVYRAKLLCCSFRISINKPLPLSLSLVVLN